MFSKYHGCGNDFLLGLYDKNVDYSKLAIKYCNRYTGIGADGLIVVDVDKSKDVKYEMIFYNADGSRAPMCGNGIRCLARFLYDEKIEESDNYQINSLSGIMNVSVKSFDPYIVTINLGKPDYSLDKLDIDKEGLDVDYFKDQSVLIDGKEFVVTCIYAATHHLVTVVDNVDCITEKQGYLLCTYPKFTKQINVNFVEVIDDENIKVKTYERGVGFTKACGTGGAACFTVLKEKKLLKNYVKNHLEFGVLEYTEIDGKIYMSGPSEMICRNIKF